MAMRFGFLLPSLALVAAAIAPPFVAPAHANFLDGDDLMNHCTATIADERNDPVICVTYIMGAYDAFMFDRLVRNLPRCTPRNLTGGRLREAVVAYLLENPDNRGMDASALVWNAIIAKWPACGNTAPARR